MARAAKEATVAELTERFQNSVGAVLTEYRGLTVAQVGQLRRSLGEHATFSVVKNTLTKIAAKDAGVVEDFSGLLVGPSAIAFVRGDVVQAAKGLRDFSKAHPVLVIKAGILDGRIVTSAEISKLADLESREVLLARLAGAMTASLAGAAATFAALPVKLARLAAALQEKRAAEGPAEVPEPATDEGTGSGEPDASGGTTPAGTAETADADRAARQDSAASADSSADTDSAASAGTEQSGDASAPAGDTDEG